MRPGQTPTWRRGAVISTRRPALPAVARDPREVLADLSADEIERIMGGVLGSDCGQAAEHFRRARRRRIDRYEFHFNDPCVADIPDRRCYRQPVEQTEAGINAIRNV